jgi:hypothetical protein
MRVYFHVISLTLAVLFIVNINFRANNFYTKYSVDTDLFMCKKYTQIVIYLRKLLSSNKFYFNIFYLKSITT